MKIKFLEVPIYDSCLIVLTGQEEEIKEYLLKGDHLPSTIEQKEKEVYLKKTYSADIPNGLCQRIPGTTKNFLIALNLSKQIYQGEKYQKGVIIGSSHEIRHYVDRLFEYLRIKDTEAAAYMTGWLMGEILPDLL